MPHSSNPPTSTADPLAGLEGSVKVKGRDGNYVRVGNIDLKRFEWGESIADIPAKYVTVNLYARPKTCMPDYDGTYIANGGRLSRRQLSKSSVDLLVHFRPDKGQFEIEDGGNELLVQGLCFESPSDYRLVGQLATTEEIAYQALDRPDYPFYYFSDSPNITHIRFTSPQRTDSLVCVEPVINWGSPADAIGEHERNQRERSSTLEAEG